MLSLCVLFTACASQLDENAQYDSLVKEVTVSVNNLKVQDFLSSDVESRTTIDMTASENGSFSGEFKWASLDTIGIFPDKGYQVAFPMSGGAGANYAKFDGGGWALKEASKYSAYFPFEYNNRSSEAIPVTFLGQKQTGNKSANHLGLYDYMYTIPDGPVNGNVNFNFEHLGSVLALHMTFPETVDVKQVEISFGEEILVEKGHINLKSANNTSDKTFIEYADVQKTNSLVLEVEDIKTTTKDEQVVVFMWIASDQAISLAGKTFKVRAFSSNKWYEFTKDYTSGTLTMGIVANFKGITFTNDNSGNIAEGTKVINEETLKAALATPPADNTPIVIDGDITLTEPLDVQSTTTIDLNGNSLNVGEQTINVNEGQTLNLINTSNYYSRSTVEVTNSITGSDDIIVVAKNSTITIGEGVNLKTTGADKCCVFVPIGAENVTINTAGNLLATQAGAATIQVNGNVTSGTINVTGGSVKHENDVAIYAAGKVQLNISGGEIEGTTGVEIRAGELNVTGGTITATGDPFASTANGNGSTSVGAAVAVCQHKTDYELSATISGGTFNGVRALYEEDLENEEATDKITMSVTGGVFNGEIYSENVKGFISGGTFSHPGVCRYLASGQSADVKLIKDVVLTEMLTIPATNTVSLDLKGYELSFESENAGDAMITNKGTLTIKDSGIEGKITYTYNGTPDTSYSKGNYTIQNLGVLTIENGIIENATAAMSHASYAINTNAGATLNIKGGKILNLNSHAIRQVSFGTSANNVTIDGGYIEGVRALQVHLPSNANAAAPEMHLTINGGELKSNEDTYNLAIYVISNGQSAEHVSLVINGAIFNGNVSVNAVATNTMAKDAVTINGGTFNGVNGVLSYSDVKSNAADAFRIKGGEFSSLTPLDYLNGEDEVVKLGKNITDAKPVKFTGEGTLNLNGKTITAIDNTDKNYELINNSGNLTIEGEGTMTVKATINSGWNRYSAVVANTVGGSLIVKRATLEHLGGTDMAYGIDNLTNGKGTYAVTTIDGATIKSPYTAVRQFLNGVEATNELYIKAGSVLESNNRSIFFQDPSINANTGKLIVEEGAQLIGNVRLYVTAGSTEWPVEVSIAASSLMQGAIVESMNVPSGYIVSENNGVWSVINAPESGLEGMIVDNM